ncbi:sterol desaturase family protein [Biomphalaria pfeifferi]|uniref:Sterol desaturase family protein n=1 Tax=Biomphalaria pfeifferi TaxID=112525 RepID=A0AAD8ETP9_BIOPF|nr:sterol desaturase family protein [Biomphalaria pfeifferi]
MEGVVNGAKNQALPSLSLDWFLWNLMFWCAVFIPLERWFALRRDQPFFAYGLANGSGLLFCERVGGAMGHDHHDEASSGLFAWVLDEQWRMSIG